MRYGTHFEIEFEVAGRTVPRKVMRADSEAEVLSYAKGNLTRNSSLFVACLGDGVDYGNLIIEVDMHGSSDVRAHEHRGFFVKGISVEQALGVLQYWLPSQDRVPDLPWLEE